MALKKRARQAKKRALTNEEKIESLNKYKEWLENEAKGVDEAIDKLKE